ncbi:MAG: alpha/beta hydrolase [Gemmatimonadaceae bacterium]
MFGALRRRLLFTAKWLCVVIVLLLIAGGIYEQLGQRRDLRRLPRVGVAVDIGGRSMNIHCSGEGTPAVIFDAGNGEPGYAWSHIQPEVAKRTRACWFDRAGEGWSDMGPFPRTSAATSADLHLLLQKAGIPSPYILVGHSLGGLNARVFNGMYPDDVAGAVLVDAAHQDEATRAPAFMLGHTVRREMWRPIWIAGQSARLVGLLRLMAPATTLSSDTARRTRRGIVRALRNQPKAIATQFDASNPESLAQGERAAGFGNRPLIVLTQGKTEMPLHPTEEDREYVAYLQVWMHEIQPKLARLSTRGRQVIVEKSGHRIPDEAPEFVIAAVHQLLEETRAPQHIAVTATPHH